MTEREKDIIEFIRFLDSLGVVKEYFALLGDNDIHDHSFYFVSGAFPWQPSNIDYWYSVDRFWVKGLTNV